MINNSLITITEGIPEFDITVIKDNAWTSSTKISELFGKDHSHVLESIRKLKKNVTSELSMVKNLEEIKQKEYA